MKVLGIDPGTAACGYGIVHESDGRLRAVVHGCVAHALRGERPELRLKIDLRRRRRSWSREHAPDAVALEESFVGADARTALSVGQARGAVLVAAASAGVECAEYAPARVKQAVCGYGRAEKAQVQRMVQTILWLDARRRRSTPPTRSPSRSATRSRRRCCRLAGMIARLRGRPVARRADGLVLDVDGVGYLVARDAAARCGRRDGAEEVEVETYLHVREDALQLYGFAEPAERELFEQLLCVSGVGPKVALAIVSGSPPADLRRAIALEDTARFEAIPGIGKKTAQRVVLELKEKIGARRRRRRSRRATDLVARDALVELGYTRASRPSAALAAVDPELPAEERVRQALRRAA